MNLDWNYDAGRRNTPEEQAAYEEWQQGWRTQAWGTDFDTCDYCGEEAIPDPPAFWCDRVQLGACWTCLNTHGKEHLQEWANSLPKLP